MFEEMYNIPHYVDDIAMYYAVIRYCIERVVDSLKSNLFQLSRWN